MNLSNVIVFLFALQGGAMFVDEFYFHRKRGLPLWERVGHPLDTLTVLSCFLFSLVMEPTEAHAWAYGALAFFSCIFVTKDEFVHKEHSSGAENWLHSILFILHPLVLIAAGLIWFKFDELRPVLIGQTTLADIFLTYQTVYWNFYAKK
ncbi:MAG: hypothetical protein IPJ84_01660 [Bdellovibrionales bacterium]|nr:hypothetical protein [Bdellovibrionales bacterium]